MSALTISRSKKAGAGLEGTWPQVNLLPPEVTAARGLKHVKQWLGVSLLLVLAVAGAGYVSAMFSKSAATSELTSVQDESTRLQAETQKYAEVQPVLSDLRRTTTARATVMAPEVIWTPVLDAIADALPANSEITTFTVQQASVTVAPPSTPDDLTVQGIATIQFTSRVPTIPDDSAWVDALNHVPGLYSASAASDTLNEVDGRVVYEVTSTVQVDPRLLANRFPASTDKE